MSFPVSSAEKKNEGMNRKVDALGTKSVDVFKNSSSDPQRLLFKYVSI